MLFALMDIPPEDRPFIFKHLGHSEEINTGVYQAPLALKEITVVGRRLQHLDTGTVVIKITKKLQKVAEMSTLKQIIFGLNIWLLIFSKIFRFKCFSNQSSNPKFHFSLLQLEFVGLILEAELFNKVYYQIEVLDCNIYTSTNPFSHDLFYISTLHF